MTFPVDRDNQRQLAADWSGDVFICDIDRTYLATRFSSFRGLAKIPFEFAVDKTAIDGMTTVLKEIRRGPDGRSRQTPLYFVSASPAQMRGVIQRKMLIDGLEFDGTTFKDWVGVVKAGRVKRFREQLGFKLTALLLGRAELPAGARETLIGDDHEADAITFAIYADLLAGRLAGDRLLQVLRHHDVADDDAQGILSLKQGIADCEGVKRAYVRLERYKSGEAFFAFAPGLVACRGALQMSISLWADGAISLDAVVNVGQELLARRYTREELTERLLDSYTRAIVGREQAEPVRQRLVEAQLVDDRDPPGPDPRWAEQARRARTEPWTPQEHLV